MITIQHTVYRILAIAFFIVCSASCEYQQLQPTSSNLIPPSEEDLAEEQARFDEFVSVARFMPMDPRAMTEDDKQWFSDHAAWDFTYAVLGRDGLVLTAEQKEYLRALMDGCIKTFNYIIYTRPFALAAFAVRRDRNLYAVSNRAADTPSALAIVLALRGINTRNLKNGRFEVIFKPNDQSYTAATDDNKAAFDAAKKSFTLSDIRAGKWDWFEAYKGRLPKSGFPAYMTIGVNSLNAEGKIGPMKDVWEFDHSELSALSASWEGNSNVSAETARYFVRGLDFNRVVHEFLHALFNWGHPSGYPEDHMASDMVYNFAGVVSMFDNGRTQTRPTLTNSEGLYLDKTGVSPELSSQLLAARFGSHMPRADGWGSGMSNLFSLRWTGFLYSVSYQYAYHRLNYAVYQPPLARSSLFMKWSPDKARDTKSTPPDPFEGIRWRIHYAE